MCGQVGWIGLLIPHCARMLVGSNNRYVVPLSLSLGACFMMIVDTLSRTVSVIELPLSVLTAIIGAPVFTAEPQGRPFLRQSGRNIERAEYLQIL